MNKKQRLQYLYEKIELTNTDDRLFLDRLKNGDSSDAEEIDRFLESSKDAKGLDKVKDFENKLILDFNSKVGTIEDMADELLGEEPTTEQIRLGKNLIAELEEILEAMKIAYLQISNYVQYEERLYNAKDEILHII